MFTIKLKGCDKYRRYYRTAGVDIEVGSDIPMDEDTFHPKFKNFEVNAIGKDRVRIRHHFSLPDLKEVDLGERVYKRLPWAVYKNRSSWIYVGVYLDGTSEKIYRIAVFNRNYTSGDIYNSGEESFRSGKHHSLTLFPTDQILLANILADRKAFYLHSCGVSFHGKGLLFVGHSGAGKSTMAKMLKDESKILCDDRIIVRDHAGGFKIHGTWSHGDVLDISSDSVALSAVFFLEKSKNNAVIPIDDKKEMNRKIISCIVRPLATRSWWNKTLDLAGRVVQEVPFYTLQFDRSGYAVDLLKHLKE